MCYICTCSCFLSHPGAFWGAFLAPLLAIILFNVVIFVCVIVVLVKHVKKTASLKNQSVSKNDAIRLIFSIGGVMTLFGLTWLFAILTFSTTGLRETFQILFTIFNSFQGLFIFVFLCVMSSEIRDEWKAFFTIKPQISTPQKQKFDQKPNPNYTATTETSCKSPTSTTPSTSESIPWKVSQCVHNIATIMVVNLYLCVLDVYTQEKLSVGRERASVSINMPFDDDCDDVFEDDEKKGSDEPSKQVIEEGESESNKPIPQPEPTKEAAEKTAAEDDKQSDSKKQSEEEPEKEAMEEKAVEKKIQ